MMRSKKNQCFYLDDECACILEQARWLLRASKNKIIADLIKGPLAAKVKQLATPQVPDKTS